MGFKFKPDICNGCRDVLLMSMKLNYIAILNIHSVDYGCNTNGISKSEALNLPQCWHKRKKWNVIEYKFSLSNIKNG